MLLSEVTRVYLILYIEIKQVKQKTKQNISCFVVGTKNK